MKRVALSVSLTKEERKMLAVRHHFSLPELTRIEALYEAALPLIQAQVCFAVAAETDLEGGRTPARPESGTPVMCAVTLGGKIDALQELYGSVGALQDDYILECLGSGLLEKAYEQLDGLIWQETGLFLNSYEFPGADMPLERMRDMLEKLSAGEADFPVSCNEVCLLQPKKSVVFMGRLGEKRTACGVCQSCPKKDCENRHLSPGPEGKQKRCSVSVRGRAAGAGGLKPENYSYGYQKIFGSRRKGDEK